MQGSVLILYALYTLEADLYWSKRVSETNLGLHDLSPVAVELPHEGRVVLKRLWSSQVLCLVRPPEPTSSPARKHVNSRALTLYSELVFTPEGWNTALRAHPRPRQNHDVLGFGKYFSEGLHVARRTYGIFTSHHTASSPAPMDHASYWLSIYIGEIPLDWRRNIMWHENRLLIVVMSFVWCEAYWMQILHFAI